MEGVGNSVGNDLEIQSRSLSVLSLWLLDKVACCFGGSGHFGECCSVIRGMLSPNFENCDWDSSIRTMIPRKDSYISYALEFNFFSTRHIPIMACALCTRHQEAGAARLSRMISQSKETSESSTSTLLLSYFWCSLCL